MQERLPFCSESATPPKVPRSTGLISWDSAIRFVLAPDGTDQSHRLVRFNLILQLRFDNHVLVGDR